MKIIDLRSDTITQPTQEMRNAALLAKVGDDVYLEDPTVNELEKLAQKILDKEAAIFVSSGTLANQLAILTHTKPGDEIILETNSHIFYYESGATAALANVQMNLIPSLNGQMELSEIQNKIREEDIHFPKTSLICLENTHNRAGGRILPINYMKEVYSLSQQHRIPLHLDGARLFNAAVASKKDIKNYTIYSDSVQVCLSKGLGAPVGSILAGNKVFIAKARKWRKRLGGGMRQAGIIAAPGIIALTKMVDRLKEDHDNAKLLAKGLNRIQKLKVNLEGVETNIVLLDISALQETSVEFIAKLKEINILAFDFDKNIVRFVTHKDITRDDILEALKRIDNFINSFSRLDFQ